MRTNVFVTQSAVPPGRWREAFPDAAIVSRVPARIDPETVVWLHNMQPSGLPPDGAWLVVLADEPTDDDGLKALSSGAAGYANAHATPELLRTIEGVVRSHAIWVGESLLNRLLASINRTAPGLRLAESHPRLAALTEREREVALAIAQGASNKEIARQLGLTERTVKAHLSAVFEKFAVRDRLQLALLLRPER